MFFFPAPERSCAVTPRLNPFRSAARRMMLTVRIRLLVFAARYIERPRAACSSSPSVLLAEDYQVQLLRPVHADAGHEFGIACAGGARDWSRRGTRLIEHL